MERMDAKTRVLVIGLDGATFEIIRPMVKGGKLPNFARLMREGSFGPLKSSMPPITPCAWTNFATGKNPSKHGIYDLEFYKSDPEKGKIINRTFVMAKPLWKLLTEAGKRSVVIDVPFTYPPEEINGVLIARVMAPSKKNCTYPKTLYYKLLRSGFIRKSEKEIAADPVRINKKKLKAIVHDRIKASFREMCEEIDKNIKLASFLMKKEPWDFFMIVFMEADHAGHGFWHHQAKMRKIYEKLDEAVGKLFELAGPNTIKFIISDHGFTSLSYVFNIDEWLREKGLLVKKIDIPSRESMKELKVFLRKVKSGENKPDDKLTKFRYRIKTDFSKSKAYLQSGTSFGIRINLEGRDRAGAVKKEEYNRFRDKLIKELREIKHPLTGRNVFSRILKKEEAYPGSPSCIGPGPDIFLLTPQMKMVTGLPLMEKQEVFKRTVKRCGTHHTEGIFFAFGEGIKKLPPDFPKITDLAPTILHTLGIPIPKDMDGRVLREIFEPESVYAMNKVRYQGSSAIKKEEKAYSKKEEREIRNRLAALGYIET